MSDLRDVPFPVPRPADPAHRGLSARAFVPSRPGGYDRTRFTAKLTIRATVRYQWVRLLVAGERAVPNEADTCRRYVVPGLQAAGWEDEPHRINEQVTFTDGRIAVAGRRGGADPATFSTIPARRRSCLPILTSTAIRPSRLRKPSTRKASRQARKRWSHRRRKSKPKKARRLCRPTTKARPSGASSTLTAARSKSPPTWSTSWTPTAANWVVQFTDYTADKVRTLFRNATELRDEWADPDRRRDIIDRPEERGIDLDHLAETANQPDADPLELQCHIGFNAPLRTRRERAERLRTEKKDFFDQYGAEARVILNELLEKYAEHGTVQFVLPDVLEVPPLSGHGNVMEIAEKYGGSDKLVDAVHQLQTLHYAA